MNMKSLSAAVVALFAAASASATSYSFTMPVAPAAPFGTFLLVSTVGSFTDYLNFTAPATAALASGSVISVDLPPFTNVDGLQISLFNGSNGSGTLIASDGTGESSELQGLSIVAGNSYSFRVTGTVANATQGYYIFSAISAPVPEPTTYAMMLAGVGAIGFLAVRRRSDKA